MGKMKEEFMKMREQEIINQQKPNQMKKVKSSKEVKEPVRKQEKIY